MENYSIEFLKDKLKESQAHLTDLKFQNEKAESIFLNTSEWIENTEKQIDDLNKSIEVLEQNGSLK